MSYLSLRFILYDDVNIKYVMALILFRVVYVISRYTELETCITPLPEVSSDEDVAGGPLEKWPKRLHAIPPRISSETVKGVTAESFEKDSQLWQKRVSYYKRHRKLNQPGRFRNLLDMNAYLGGFAASWVDDPVWVMNIVPAEAEVNTLGVIYERGLIGTYQSW